MLMASKNIALNKLVRASSINNDNFPSGVVDGDKTSDFKRWVSTQDDNNVWLCIDLGGMHIVDEIRIYSGYQSGSQSFISSVKIEIEYY